MLCKRPECPGDMKYFKTIDVEGYKCPLCGFYTLIIAQDASDYDLSPYAECITYDETGCMCIDEDILEVYAKVTYGAELKSSHHTT